MTLYEWDELLYYGETLCNDLREAGHNVEPRVYYMYDGRKGISFIVRDRRGNFHKEYFSGIGSLATMKNTLAQNARRIRNGE